MVDAKPVSQIINKLNNKLGYYLFYKFYLHFQKVQLGRKISFKNRPIIKNRGTIIIGNKVTFDSFPDGEFCRTRVITNYKNSKIIIGDNSLLRGATIWASDKITIGNNFLAAPFAWVVDNDAHGIDPARRDNRYAKAAPVTIGNNVWVGYRAIVLKGVSIGDNSIIAAGAIVTKSIPADSIAAGIPAKVVGKV